MIRSLGRKKLVRDISANTLQIGITQFFGLLIFYLTSKFLAKNDFGELNWTMAIGSTVIAISSLGLDLIYVKRIALGQNILVLSGIHFFHTVIVGLALATISVFIHFFIPGFNFDHPVFSLVFVNLALANIANSFKLCLNGLEAYKKLAVLALISNLTKFALVISLYLFLQFTLFNVIVAYALASFIELLFGYFALNRSLSAKVKPVLKIIEYKYFILESLPQLGVVLFDSALARVDWILLGILSSAAATAEYSFAYKIFELSKLPLLIIAPILLTRFSKIFNKDEQIPDQQKKDLAVFFKVEMFVVMLIPVFLVTTWTPLIDGFTNNKYGYANELNFIILACCVPLHGMINYLWTLGFVQGQLKTIMTITIVTAVFNILLNVLLIPGYGSGGSAFSFLICTVIQLALYFYYTNQSQVRLNFGDVIPPMLTASAAVLIARVITDQVFIAAAIALVLYSATILLTRQISLPLLKAAFIRK